MTNAAAGEHGSDVPTGLFRRELLGLHSWQRAINEAGGLWTIPSTMDRWDLIRQRPLMLDEARRRGIRALDADQVDESLVRALPDLEFLVDDGVSPGPLIQRLGRLRALGLATWEGELDLRQLPLLEWLTIGESKSGHLDSLADGHPSLHLTVGMYRYPDLAAVGRLRLERLSLGNSRRLMSLARPGLLAETLVGLELWMLPALGSLDGIGAFETLQALTLSSVRGVTTLDSIRELPKLRLLDVGELKNVESLAPLAGHPSLEWLAIGRTQDMDLAPLRSLPRLRLHRTPPGRWRGDVAGLPAGAHLDWRDPEYAEMLRFKNG
jgi:Leucine-rich repeat (LRR) protein